MIACSPLPRPRDCGRITQTIILGGKGKSSILHSMDPCAAFPQDQAHRIRFVRTPKHTSWQNQIEIWFSILVRRLLKRTSFTSTDELCQPILAFIDYFNKTMGKAVKADLCCKTSGRLNQCIISSGMY